MTQAFRNPTETDFLQRPGPLLAILYVSFFLLIFVLGPRLIPGHFLLDSNLILELMEEVKLNENEGSFFVTAYVFSLIPVWLSFGLLPWNWNVLLIMWGIWAH